jgi:hypothetical protein
MPRYGGGQEDFRAEQARLAAIQERLAAIEGKELQAAKAADELGTAEERATVRRRALNQAKREGADITAREEAVAGQEARAVDVDTAAIERNRAARERRAAIARQEQINVQRAFRGAADPLFAQATASGATSQYALRRNLGIGQGRAANLQEAIAASFLSPGGPQGNVGAQTRVQAAQEAVVQADVQLAEAKRQYAAAVRRGDVAAGAAASADREAANAAKAAAKIELESAQKAAASATEVAAARRAAASVVAGQPGGALIVHPTARTGVLTHAEAVEPGIAQSMALARAEREAAAAAELHIAAMEKQVPVLSALSDAERVYIAGLTAERRAVLESAAANARLAEGEIAARSEASAMALKQEAVALGAVNQSMYKHGALSQEYILAAARGETTLRDLGNQALVTAGKFGAWTAAATGIFAVAGALSQVGSGAIAAQSGATGLQRFIPNLNRDEAIRGFTQTSRELNVPIKDVADTQGVLARVFNNQRDSLLATSVALKAYKLDQVDAADSARYFTAIVQEGRLPVERLPGLFDQLDNSQRKFGARVQETLPALARSFGAVKNAGGDLNQLIALIATAQTASGQTGNTVGTAFSRAASNFFRRPDNVKTLQGFGLDPSKGFTQLVIDAVQKAQTLSGTQRIELAKAIAGPQYGGRIFTPLLNQAERLAKAREVSSPEASRGKADEELHKLLQQTDQELHKLGLSLQRLGAELSQSGAFRAVGDLLKILIAVLGVTEDIIGVFNQLPKPLRTALSVAAEIVIAMKLMRRFGGESLAGGRLAAFAAPEQQFAVRARRSLRDIKDDSLNEAERTQRNSTRLSNAARRAQIDAERIAAESAAVAAANTGRSADADEARAAADQRVAEANARAKRLSGQAAVAAQEAADARLIASAADEEYAAAAKLSARQLRIRAEAQALPLPVETGVPSTAGTYRAGADGIATAERESRALNADRDLTARARKVQGTLGAYYGTWGRNVERLGKSGALIDKAATSAISVTSRTVSGVERGIGKLRGLGSSMAGLASALGPLDYALIGLTAFELLKDPIKNVSSDVGRHYFNVDDIEKHAAMQEAALRKQFQAQHRAAGTPLPQLTYGQLAKSIDQDAAARREGIISQREFDRRMANHAVEAKILYGPSKRDIEAARAALAAANRAQGGRQSYAASLRGLSAQDLDSEQTAVAGQYATNPARGIGHLRAVYQEYTRRYGSLNDAKSVSALLGARQNFFQALSDRANAELQLDNSRTGDPAQQAANSVRTAESLARQARTVFGRRSTQYAQAITQLNQARAQQGAAILAHVQAEGALLTAQAGNDPIAQANAAVQVASLSLQALLRQGRRADPNQILQARAQVISARNSRSQTIHQQNQQIADLYGQLAQANAGGDGVAAAQAAQRAARAALSNSTTKIERLQALVGLAQANKQLEQAIADRQSARFDLLESLTTDPVTTADIEVRRARAAIRGTQGADRTRAQAAYNKAIQADRDARLQSREDDIDFEQTMGRITIQDAISRYSTLLHIRNLTKQQRRDIELKIHQLQSQSESEASGFNLDIGTFKLPTLFDVHKAFAPVRRQAHDLRAAAFRSAAQAQADISSNVSHLYDARSQVQATINIEVNDKHAAGEVYTAIDRALGTSVRARMRSRGLRG